MLEIIKAILLGIIQGITEWLPVSSTGHMILFDAIWPLNVSQDFLELFLVVIQFGSILAVVVLFFKQLWPFSKDKEKNKKIWQLWFRIIVACIPAAVIGLLLDDWIDEHFYNPVTVAVMLIVYGVLFILIEKRNKEPRVLKIEDISYTDAFKIGCFQVLALIPGTSRSGATILGSILLGLKRSVAAKFSFFLAIPVMLGASMLKIVKFFLETNTGFTAGETGILLSGTVTAFIVSLLVIKFFLDYIRKHDFTVFGYYRIILGVIILLFSKFL